MPAPLAPLRFAVIGDPIDHSRSPRMHEAAYRALGMPHRYEKRRVAEADLAAAISDLRRGVYDGYNVTAPHKTRVLTLVDQIDPSASLPGAANTLVREPDETLTAYNTDVDALCTELTALAPEREDSAWQQTSALILGAGGTARAAVVALAERLRVQHVVLRLREPTKADVRHFVDHLRSVLPGLDVVLEPLAAANASDRRFSTLVQATSSREVAHAVSWKHVDESAIALDVMYGAKGEGPTAFLQASRDHGLRSSDGLGMLVRQGARAFERWLGVSPPVSEMRKALE